MQAIKTATVVCAVAIALVASGASIASADDAAPSGLESAATSSAATLPFVVAPKKASATPTPRCVCFPATGRCNGWGCPKTIPTETGTGKPVQCVQRSYGLECPKDEL